MLTSIPYIVYFCRRIRKYVSDYLSMFYFVLLFFFLETNKHTEDGQWVDNRSLTKWRGPTGSLPHDNMNLIKTTLNAEVIPS